MRSRTKRGGGAEEEASPLAPGPRGAGTLRLVRAFRIDAARALADLAATYGDVVQFRFFGRLNTLVVHPDAVSAVLVGHAGETRKGLVYDAYRPLIGDGLLTSDGEGWATSRRIAQPCFRGPRLAAFARVVAEAGEAAAARWADRRDEAPLDMHAELNGLTFTIVARALFSTDLPAEDQAVLFRALAVANREGTARIRAPFKTPFHWPTPANRRYAAAVARLDAVVAGLVAARRARSGAPDDYLSALLAAEAAGTIDGRMVRDQALTFLFAGHETTANALAWALHLLATHPDWAEAVAREAAEAPAADDEARTAERLPVARAVFEETMRLYPPIYALQRRALSAIDLGGWRVPAGTGITVSPFATHRHPDFWPEPERFDPRRFLDGAATGRPRGAYLPFGAGPRTCIGANFALLEGVLLLSRIMRRVRVRPVPGHVVRTSALIALTPRGGLPLVVEPRAG